MTVTIYTASKWIIDKGQCVWICMVHKIRATKPKHTKYYLFEKFFKILVSPYIHTYIYKLTLSQTQGNLLRDDNEETDQRSPHASWTDVTSRHTHGNATSTACHLQLSTLKSTTLKSELCVYVSTGRWCLVAKVYTQSRSMFNSYWSIHANR